MDKKDLKNEYMVGNTIFLLKHYTALFNHHYCVDKEVSSKKKKDAIYFIPLFKLSH